MSLAVTKQSVNSVCDMGLLRPTNDALIMVPDLVQNSKRHIKFDTTINSM